jgi:Ala-tRNA(Pro) deacylase
MLDSIVRYLHESLTPFRLSSYPSLEHLPKAVEPVPKYAVLVESRLVFVADKLTLLCYPANEQADISAVANELDAAVLDAGPEDLPAPIQRYNAPPPPLGQLYGLPIIIDEAVTRYAAIVFQPFGESDYVEVPYDDFARLEQPRVASFARAGELAEHVREQPAASAPG